jgi:hypothetical protein
MDGGWLFRLFWAEMRGFSTLDLAQRGLCFFCFWGSALRGAWGFCGGEVGR